MEITLRKGLEPVNAAEDKAESLIERSKFDEGPGASFTGSWPLAPVSRIILLSMSIVCRILWKSPCEKA